jgi:hypothetical protein
MALLYQPETARRVLANCPRLLTLRIAALADDWPDIAEVHFMLAKLERLLDFLDCCRPLTRITTGFTGMSLAARR